MKLISNISNAFFCLSNPNRFICTAKWKIKSWWQKSYDPSLSFYLVLDSFFALKIWMSFWNSWNIKKKFSLYCVVCLQFFSFHIRRKKNIIKLFMLYKRTMNIKSRQVEDYSHEVSDDIKMDYWWKFKHLLHDCQHCNILETKKSSFRLFKHKIYESTSKTLK